MVELIEVLNHFLLNLICFLVGYRLGRKDRRNNGVERDKNRHTDA